jgi:hypothetical protein
VIVGGLTVHAEHRIEVRAKPPKGAAEGDIDSVDLDFRTGVELSVPRGDESYLGLSRRNRQFLTGGPLDDGVN